jgi:plastocyanin
METLSPMPDTLRSRQRARLVELPRRVLVEERNRSLAVTFVTVTEVNPRRSSMGRVVVFSVGSFCLAFVAMARMDAHPVRPVGNAPRKVAVQLGAIAAAASPATAASGKRSKTVTMNGVTYADHGAKDVRKLSTLELEADNYYFGPTFLRGNPGQKVTLMMENEASTLHNITIPALGIDKDIPPKGKVRLDVTFPASGVLTFSCKFHGPLGMNGMLKTGD